MEKFKEYRVYTRVKRTEVPKGATVARPVTVFTRKMTPDNQRIIKCRVTVNGSTISQDDTSTSNVDMAEIRLLFSIASTSPDYSGRYCTADAEQGYLQVDARGDEIYLIPPEMHPDYAEGFLWKLDKNVYGVPNAGAVFEDKVRDVLQKTGWKRLRGTKHCWIKDKHGVIYGYMAVYVDDFLAIGVKSTPTELFSDIAKELKINIQPESPEDRFIGNMFRKLPDGTLVQDQHHYASSLQTTFEGVQFDTPLPERVNEKEDKSDPVHSAAALRAYRGTLGQAMFISRDSRPDLAFATSHLSKLTHRLTKNAVKYSNRVVAYTKDKALPLPIPSRFVSPELNITAYVDASMGNSNDPHGTTGWIIFINDYPVAWRSKKQTRVSRSSLKAELIALHDLVDYMEWLCNILATQKKNFTAEINTDSKDLVQLVNARHPKPTEKNDIFTLEHIREKVGVVPLHAMKDALSSVKQLATKYTVQHIPGESNPSDALTKSAGRRSLQVLIDKIRSVLKKKERGGK